VARRYEALSGWLRDHRGDEVTLDFADLERLVGPLPTSARKHRPWWGNNGSSPQARAWISAGWVVGRVDLHTQRVTFRPDARPELGRSARSIATRTAVLDGRRALEDIVARAGWASVAAAVAAHAVFLAPETVAQAKGRAMFPVVRNPQRRGQFDTLEGGRRVLLDDNTTPTAAFLWSANRRKGNDVQFNHVWTRSNDPETYTALWNLCCTPAFLAKTSDTHPDVVAALRYRSYELYCHLPAGVERPREPAGYESLIWAPMPEPLVNLEQSFRARMRDAPKHRASLTARTIGWLFSDGPDLTV
jgi:hypothetical protein